MNLTLLSCRIKFLSERGARESTATRIINVAAVGAHAWAGGKAQGARGRLRYAGQDLFRCVGGPLVDGTFIVIRDQDMGKETG
jgi:hypothetical protein